MSGVDPWANALHRCGGSNQFRDVVLNSSRPPAEQATVVGRTSLLAHALLTLVAWDLTSSFTAGWLARCAEADGLSHPDIKKLAGGAAFVARKMGFPEAPISYPKLWDQMDDWSCGWHVLHFLKFLLLDTNNIADLRASLFSCLAQPTIFLFV